MSNRARKRFHQCYPLIDNGGVCVYCGVRADSLDHFVPTSITRALLSCSSVVSMGGCVKVPACRECNSIAGANLFKTIAAKRRYIQDHLRKKYRSYLDTPNWAEDELEELGPGLRPRIESGVKLKQWITERLGWRNNRNMAHAKLAIVNFESGKLGRGIAVDAAMKKLGENEPRKSLLN